MRNKLKGFTLIELMVTVVIIGILASIAFPAYQNSVRQARRADAQGVLMQLNNTMERVFTQSNTYTIATLCTAPATPAGCIFPNEAPLDGATKFYDLSISAVTANTFTLLATPKNGQAGDGNLTLNSTGAKTWGALNSWRQ